MYLCTIAAIYLLFFGPQPTKPLLYKGSIPRLSGNLHMMHHFSGFRIDEQGVKLRCSFGRYRVCFSSLIAELAGPPPRNRNVTGIRAVGVPLGIRRMNQRGPRIKMGCVRKHDSKQVPSIFSLRSFEIRERPSAGSRGFLFYIY
ncbi:hypothetical protein F5X96DRAFT_427215 [Biscogniauxia mediterranea]|nr:hypothetical protein F5X96DRAFT_427215 [Biscogniauxia mediterranea]